MQNTKYKSQSPYHIPVTIDSSHNVTLSDYASEQVTETFTRKFENNALINSKLLEEMRTLYRVMDKRFSARECQQANDGMCDFLEFVVKQGGLDSLGDLTSSDAAMFYAYLEGKGGNWKSGYKSLRPRLKEVVSIDFPTVPTETNFTEGLSVEGIAAFREALCAEIDSIRGKIGQFENALKSGKVLKLPSIKKQRFISAEDVEKVRNASKDDIIKTICQYIPKYPLNRPVNIKSKKAEYQQDEGRYLLFAIFKCCGERSPLMDAVREKFNGPNALYNHYFPTIYDITVFSMYVGLVTGWNIGAIQSVGRDELNLVFKRNRYQGILGKDHVVLTALKPRRKQIKPKKVTHISDINDRYGVFNVMKDFYALSEPIRKLASPKEARVIFLGIREKGEKPICLGPGVTPGDLKRLSSGESRRNKLKKAGSRTPEKPAEKFFAKHEVYDEPGVRVEAITWQQIRTSYETVIEDMGLPLYVRQKLLGHASMDVSMLYGSDPKSVKLQMKKLGKILFEIHEEVAGAKFFQGAILTDQNDPRTKPSGNVIMNAFKDWQDNYIMLCKDAKNPTWAGHEMYVKKGQKCSWIGKCLLCQMSFISRDTLPHLVSWSMDIDDYFDADGEWDTDTQWLVVQKACDEALSLWAEEVDPEDVKEAQALAKSRSFERIPLDIWNVSGLIEDEC